MGHARPLTTGKPSEGSTIQPFYLQLTKLDFLRQFAHGYSLFDLLGFLC